MPFENTPLPYAFDALEPYIDARTMEIHHGRHLLAYIDSLNRAIEPFPALQKCTAAQLAVMNAPALRQGHRFALAQYEGWRDCNRSVVYFRRANRY